MRRFLFLFLALPIMFASCDDDDSFPAIEMNLSMSGGKILDNIIYVVSGDTLTVDSVKISSRDGKDVMIGGVTYFWDYAPLYTSNVNPFSATFPTENMPLGNHLFQLDCTMYAVDYAPIDAIVTYKVKIVMTPEEIPTEATPLMLKKIKPYIEYED